MRVDAFNFDLPGERIANRPARPRDSARLLVVEDELTDAKVRDLPKFLRSGDLVVVNDTRVIPARLSGQRGQAKVEVTLDRDLGEGKWRALGNPAKKLQVETEIIFSSDFKAVVIAKGERGLLTLDFHCTSEEVLTYLEKHGSVPLPPYIARPHGPDGRYVGDYQTIYADQPGAIAAPTAGLHFTPTLLSALENAGVGLTRLTLHIGSGTFTPVTVLETRDHKMSAEWGELSPAAASAINSTRARGGRIVAVGTTVLRLLESASDDKGFVKPYKGDTDLFITPGFRFRIVDLLVTNFHLPKSTLFMLVSAFSGLDRMLEAYVYAIGRGYRFYSYGDASLLRLNVI